MPRARNIKPSFFTDEDIVDLSVPTRLLFIGMWTIADREGRLQDKAKQIKMHVFPADDIDVENALSELASAKRIVRYVIKGERFIEVVNFTKHQNPHIKETASTIPAPCKPRARTRRAALIPDSLNSDSFQSESNGGETPAADAAPDPVSVRIWNDGRELLMKSGLTKSSAGDLLGKLVKDHGKPKVAQAIAITQAENSANPKTYLLGILNGWKADAAKMNVGKAQDMEKTWECDVCFDDKVLNVPDTNGPYSYSMKEVDCECATANQLVSVS